MHEVRIPDFALVVLLGASGAERRRFAARHFRTTEVLSPETCAALVADEAAAGTATAAHETLHFLAAMRLHNRRITVVDPGTPDREPRKELVALARKHHALPVAVTLGTEVEPQGLRADGFRQIHVLEPDRLDDLIVHRVPLWVDRRHDAGPFDIIGDVHGCGDELEALLRRLGCTVAFHGNGGSRECRVQAMPERTLVFLGDLVDRGPRAMDVLRMVMTLVEDGHALCVAGNHDDKFRRWLEGRNVQVAHGLAQTIDQAEAEPEDFRRRVHDFLSRLQSHYWLDDGRLCVAHAGLTEDMIGRTSGAVRAFTLYGQTSGETDDLGLPVRRDWAADYRGSTRVVYGHTPVQAPEWVNGTICIDTGCVFGGSLTALRYPEGELVSVPARHAYFGALTTVRQDS